MGKSRNRRVSTPQSAARRFRESLAQGRGSVRGDGDLAGQSYRYQMARAEAEVQATMVKQWLYGRGVPLCTVATWMNFARHVGRQHRHYGGATLALLARMAVERWAKYGLSRELLECLCRDIYNIELVSGDSGGDGPGVSCPVPEL